MARRCLLIANQHYGDPAFEELPGAVADADALSAVLRRPDIGDFEVAVVKDATGVQFRRSIESFFRQAGREDLLWLHLSCHGMKSRDNRLFLIATDTERDYLASTGVDCTFVNDQVEHSRSAKVVVFLDCCYSGAFSRGLRTRSGPDSVDVAEVLGGRGRVVITASNALQFSHESIVSSREAAEPSVFTSSIVEGLRTGDADLDFDGHVSVEELYEFVHGRVQAIMPNQTPTLSVSSAEGTIHLARSARLGASLLPPMIVSATRSPLAWQRIGVIHELENLLSSRHEPVRAAAMDALAALVADADPVVGARARAMWLGRGLGDLPVAAGDVSRSSPTSYVAGIDFGTTNSSVAVFDAGECRIVPNPLGERTTPSVAACTATGEWIVGEPARRQQVANAARTFSSVKLRLGTDWTCEVDGERFAAEDIAAVILRQLKEGAEAYLGGTIVGAVLTVPAYFDIGQRRATVTAAERAGLRVLRVMTEPTAAALAYGVDKGRHELRVLVYDLGGGTFDVSLLELGFSPALPTVGADFDAWVVEVEATGGDNRLGGDNWDQRIVEWLASRFAARHGIDLTNDGTAMQRLREVAERAKIELSSAGIAAISVPYVAFDRDRTPLAIEERLSRAQFQEMTADLVERTGALLTNVLKEAHTTIDRVDEVVLVGGATRMPAVGALITGLTGTPPRRGLIPDGVATGAAIQGAVLSGLIKDVLLLDVMPMSLGIACVGGIMTKVVERDTTIPTKRSEVFTTADDGRTAIAVRVYQGEREIAADNLLLGAFDLTGIAAAARGTPRIEITFDIDANGIVKVTATEVGTDNRNDLVLPARAGTATDSGAAGLPSPLPGQPQPTGPARARFDPPVMPQGAAEPHSTPRVSGASF